MQQKMRINYFTKTQLLRTSHKTVMQLTANNLFFWIKTRAQTLFICPTPLIAKPFFRGVLSKKQNRFVRYNQRG